MTFNPPALVDTNVLVYSLYPESDHFAASRALLESTRDSLANLFFAPQNIAEFLAIVTNPRRVTQPKTVAEAIQAVEAFKARPGLSILVVPVNIIDLHIKALQEVPVAKARVFDAQLVAVMRGNGITDIYTFNASDFRGYAGINAHVPTA
jgi:toxin-antitoxin system PIN domain toxin